MTGAGRRNAMQVRPIQPSFAAEIDGVDLAKPTNTALVGEIWRAIDTCSVLVFHDQNLTDLQLRDFAAQFGLLEIGRSAARGGPRRLALPEIGDISNLGIDSNVRQMDDRRRLDSLGNRLWHTDASYMPVPVVLGLLHAKALPPPPAPSATGKPNSPTCAPRTVRSRPTRKPASPT
jgi:alpha-ketoglutarate-dependent 2,4-dichlorophenoxyacetate dioxygenase